MLGLVHEIVANETLKAIAEYKHHGRRERYADRRGNAEIGPQHIAEIHPDNDHLAMREVHHAHDPEDDVEPCRDQRVDRADQQAVDHHAGIELQHLAITSVVIPGPKRSEGREPGIHNPGWEYGFRARRSALLRGAPE